ncbi:MAG TPA: hypothetical protein VIM56_12665 [Rhizomicrobium sp.]
MKSSLVSATALTFVTALALAATTDAASARGWHSSRTFYGAHRSVNVSRGYEHGGGQASGYRDVQGSRGRGYDASFNRSCSNSTCSRNGSIETSAGKSVSRSGSITNNHDGSVSYDRTTTGPNGNEVTRSGTVSYDPH